MSFIGPLSNVHGLLVTEDRLTQRAWLSIYWSLLAVLLITAALNMLHLRGGFLTNHAADVVVPAWMYVGARGLHSTSGLRTRVQRTLGQSPEIAALGLFFASALTEVSQYYWPHGLFRGRFDPLDILSYAVGLVVCYAFDKRSVFRASELRNAEMSGSRRASSVGSVESRQETDAGGSVERTW